MSYYRRDSAELFSLANASTAKRHLESCVAISIHILPRTFLINAIDVVFDLYLPNFLKIFKGGKEA